MKRVITAYIKMFCCFVVLSFCCKLAIIYGPTDIKLVKVLIGFAAGSLMLGGRLPKAVKEFVVAADAVAKERILKEK